jgi:hypothetical protein
MMDLLGVQALFRWIEPDGAALGKLIPKKSEIMRKP